MLRRRSLLAALLAAAPTSALAAGAKKDAAASQDPMVALPTLTATVIRPDGRRGVLTVQATLYATDPAKRLKTQQSLPRLVDAYVTALQRFGYRLVPGRTPDVELLGSALQGETDRLLGRGVKLLLGGVMVN